MNPSTPKMSPASLHRRKVKIVRIAGDRRSKRGAPSTPLSQWKLEDKPDSVDNGGRDRLQFPARKLAAGLWQLHYREISGAGVEASRRVFHNRRRPQGEVLHRHHESRYSRAEVEPGLQRQLKAAKWDAETPKTADEIGRFYSNVKLPEEQSFTAASAVSHLKAELSAAQKRICKLESQQQHSQKKVERLKKRLEEDRGLGRSRRQLKFGVDADGLDGERRTRTKTESLNASLVKELADAKLYARKYKQEYEKEKRSRELTEEVCAELAKQLLEDKAKVDSLKEESAKLCEELDEERKMLQMAEVWREERIQMKLIDAKLALEDKYLQMNKLITDLESFLVSRNEKLDVMELKRAELIQQAAKSVDIEDMDDLFYEPRAHNLMQSLLEDLKQGSNFKEIEQCINYNQGSQDSSFGLDSFGRSPKMKCDLDRKSGDEGEGCREEAEEGDNSESKTKCSEKQCDDSESKASERRKQERTLKPGVRRGVHGCIEWPRGIQRHLFKTKPLNARIESQKSQLRHILKQRHK